MLAYSVFIVYFFANFVTLLLLWPALRIFIWCTYLRMYVLAVVILFYCAVGVLALNNVTFDIWTMFLFGILGYGMKLLGFPLVPMILGVVLGNIAEINLNRAISTSVDPTLFFTRPWSLFFLIIAAFSAIFPAYQASLGTKRWTLFYTPALAVSCAIPLFMMKGMVRPAIAACLVAFAAWVIWQRWRNGWQVKRPEHKLTLGEEI